MNMLSERLEMGKTDWAKLDRDRARAAQDLYDSQVTYPDDEDTSCGCGSGVVVGVCPECGNEIGRIR